MRSAVVGAAFLLVLCGAGPSPAAPLSTAALSHSIPKGPAVLVGAGRQILSGWLSDYDGFIKAEVRKYPGLLGVAPDRLSNFCPGFAKIRDKAKFYADLLWAIAGAESDRQRTQITLETDLDGVKNPIDPVTGLQVRSEGLLQLSYQDTLNYDAPRACPFDWRADKAKALADYRRGAANGDGTRTIHDAYKNLRCGVFILNAHLSQLAPAAKFEDALRQYWITMDPADPGYRKIRRELKKRQPSCK